MWPWSEEPYRHPWDRPQALNLRFRNWWQREVRLKTYRCTGCGFIARQRRDGARLKLHGCTENGRIMKYLPDA